MSFLAEQDLKALGFATLGRGVKLSRKASIYGAERIHLGDQCRIDDFTILSAGSGGIVVGRYVHVAAFCSLIGDAKITLEDFSGLSSRVSIYSSSDDYTGRAMTNPTIPDTFRKVDTRPVRLGRHCIVGAGSVILPGVTLGEGSALGALSLASRDVAPFTIASGVPAKRIGDRKRGLIDLESDFSNLEV